MENTYTFSSHPDLDAMFDFLEEKLPDSEMQRIDAHLLECDACAAALEEMDRAGGPTADMRKQAAEFQEVFLSAAPAGETAHPARKRKARSAWNAFFRVAAMVLLALNIGWASWYISGGKSAAEFAPRSADTDRGNAPAELDIALQVYQKGQYEEAVALLKALPDDPAIVEMKLLYLGNAFLALGRNTEALAPLNQLVANPDWTLYRTEAHHYLEIAHRRLAEKEE